MKPKRNPLAQVGRALVRVVHPEMAAYLESEDQAAKEVMAEILEPEMAAHLESGSRSRGGTMKNHLRNWWAENHGWRMELLWDDMKEHLAVALGWLVLLGFLYVLIRPFFVGAWVVGACVLLMWCLIINVNHLKPLPKELKIFISFLVWSAYVYAVIRLSFIGAWVVGACDLLLLLFPTFGMRILFEPEQQSD